MCLLKKEDLMKNIYLKQNLLSALIFISAKSTIHAQDKIIIKGPTETNPDASIVSPHNKTYVHQIIIKLLGKHKASVPYYYYTDDQFTNDLINLQSLTNSKKMERLQEGDHIDFDEISSDSYFINFDNSLASFNKTDIIDDK